MKKILAIVAATAVGAAAAGVLFEENFRFYSDHAPKVTRDDGVLIGCDGVWNLFAQLDCNATRPLDVFSAPVALPADGRFNFSCRFMLPGRQGKDEATFFEVAFADAQGRRQQLAVASDRIGGIPVDWIGGGQWRYLVLKANVNEVEIFFSPGRLHELRRIGSWRLDFPARELNIACTPGKRFTITDVKLATPDEPVFSFPVEDHFADFRSLSQGLPSAAKAKGGEEIRLGPGGHSGVRFQLGSTNAAVSVKFVDAQGKEEVYTSRIGDCDATRRDAYIAFSRPQRKEHQFSLWVRPSMRPFCENSECGQRGMVGAGEDILREWDRLPKASQHVFTLEFIAKGSGEYCLYLDGSFRQIVKAQSIVFSPGKDVRFEPIDRTRIFKEGARRYTAIDLSDNPRAKAMSGAKLKGLKSGLNRFGGVPVYVAEGMDSADVAICRQGKGNWALEVEEYHGRSPDDGFPMAIHYRVPAAEYCRAHIVFALDPDPAKDAILTVRIGRYQRHGVGGNMLGDKVLDFRKGIPDCCQKVGEIVNRGKTLVLYKMEVPVDIGRILDLVSTPGDYLDFELIGKGWENFQQLDNSMKPDPNSRSAFNIFGVTLEEAPFVVAVKETAPGNLFTIDEKAKKTSFEITATEGAAKGSVGWEAKDIDGNSVFNGECKWSVGKAGETATVDIPLDRAGPGWYSLAVKFIDGAGRELFVHDAAFGILPEAGRAATRHESPYAIWWFNCHGSTGDPEIGGPILQKCGIRKFSWNMFKEQAIYDKYDLTSCGNFMLPGGGRKDFDEGKGEFKPHKVRGKDKKEIELSGEEWFVSEVRSKLEKMPADAKPHGLIWHESAPRGFLAEEIIDLPVPSQPPYPHAAKDAKYIKEVSRLMRKHFPGVPLQIGNTTWSSGAAIGPLRAGAPIDCYDFIGIETPSQTIVPERLIDCGLQGMQITMDIAEAISGKRPRCNGTWEFTYRTERDLGLRRQAQWYMRDILISLAHDFFLISPGIFFDCSSGYYNGLWGGSGLMHRSPYVYPKPAIVAYGVLTKALDGVVFSRQLDTGSTTVYALEFRRKDGRYATALWASRGEVEFAVDSPSGGRIVRMLGAEEKLPRGQSKVLGGEDPCYLITDKPLQSVKSGRRTYLKAAKIIANAKVAAAFDDAAEIELAPDPWIASDFHNHLPYLQPSDEFTLSTVEDEEKGPVVELRLGPPKTEPKSKYSDRYITRYTTMRLKNPKPIAGRPAVLGVWVKGDSNWGQIRFEIEDAKGEVFKNISTGRWWMCDIMDWPGNLAVNFDGWSYCYCSLTDNTLITERSPGTVAEQWVSEGGDKRIDFPVKLRAISVGVNRTKLDLIDFKPATNVLRFRDMGGSEDE